MNRMESFEFDPCLTHIITGHFDEALIRHQVKYLGLMEHLRVRRAGFAYRRKYEVFLKRFEGAQSLEILFDFLITILLRVGYLLQVQTAVPGHLASLERIAR